MKQKLIYSILICAAICSHGQSLNGCWGNSFGSRMQITDHDVTTGLFRGTYGSHTGSTGVYEFFGKTTPGATTDQNLAVSFAISWSTIAGKPFPDASAHWTGVMTGYYRASDKTLQLLNVISAPTAFPEVDIIKGIYPESLVFTQMSSSECGFTLEEDPKLKAVREALVGKWNSYLTPNVGSILIEEVFSEKGVFVTLEGYMFSSVDGSSHPIIGVCSFMTDENSLSISLVVDETINDTNYNLTVSGYLEDGKMRLFETETRAPNAGELSIVSNAISYDLYVKQ